MDQKEIKICPLVENYQFVGKCSIKSCQNFTPVTCSGCLMLDRTERSDSIITDNELLYYKMKPNKTAFDKEDLEVKDAIAARKKYETRVKNNILFFLYVEYVKHNHKPSPLFHYVSGVSVALDQIIEGYPFNQNVVNFEPWMLLYLLNVSVFSNFTSSEHRFDVSGSTICGLLAQTPGKYKTLKEEVKGFQRKLKQQSKSLLKR